MSPTISRRAAVAAVIALGAVAPAAAQAELVPPLSPVTGDVHALGRQVAADANALAGSTLGSTHATAGHTLQSANDTAGHTAVLSVRTVRNVTVRVYGVLDPVGQTLAGHNVASVSTPATGQVVITWQTASSGCSTLAVSNGLVLPVQRIAPNSVRVLRRNTRAGAGVGRIAVNVIC